jgi:hypothetical protein
MCEGVYATLLFHISHQKHKWLVTYRKQAEM